MRIAVLAFDGISPFMLSTPLAVFGEPFLATGHRVDVCAAAPRIAIHGGLAVEIPHRLAVAEEADVVILPGWRDADEPVPPALTNTLQAAAAHGAIAVGLCLGAFGLAEAGLLDGRRATTHWARIETFAARYPRVRVDPGAIFVDEGAVVSSAGIASGLDCCLHILARTAGVSEAHRVARHLVVAPQRVGAAPQLIEKPAIGSPSEQRIAAILQKLRADPSEPPSLEALAREAGMSRRSLTRHIRAHTGDSLSAWLRRARVVRAQALLAGGARGYDQIASSCGFPDPHALRAAFRAEFGMTPSQWRARQRLD